MILPCAGLAWEVFGTTLCEFLDVPVPESEFPNVNNRAAIKKTVRDLTKGAYVILGAGSAAFVGLIYGAFRFFY